MKSISQNNAIKCAQFYKMRLYYNTADTYSKFYAKEANLIG